MQLKLKSRKPIKVLHLNTIQTEIEIKAKHSNNKLPKNSNKSLKLMAACQIPKRKSCMIQDRLTSTETKALVLEEWAEWEVWVEWACPG